MGNSILRSLTLRDQLVNILNKPTVFERFEEDVFYRPSVNQDLKGRGSKTIATTKMEPFEQVTMCFGILERKTIAMVDEARSLYRV